ncbi:Holliday junction resolvase RuvX [Paenarthrobacter sp. NPDC018779]|uniref:Holliday junction resolvase RuvX n=1 Tax=Paenarthrobacter sp. NPDC018779 TaxID=3364375 RepID=UPI0037CA8987
MGSSSSGDVYPRGIKLGVDVGTVRVGLAICDPDGILATPFKTVGRDAKKNSDIRVVVKQVAELGAVQVVVGLPRTMKGEERASARMASEYAELLADALLHAEMDVPVNLVDERLTTVTAHRNLHEAGMSSKNHRKVVDQVAAAGILQHAIDMQRARGTDVGRRVQARAQSETPSSAPTLRAASGSDPDSSTRGLQL